MLTELTNVLSGFVETPEQIRDILQDAGVTSQHVALQGSPYQMWRAALEYAVNDSSLPSLLSVLRGRYPHNNKLFDAELRYWSAVQLGSASSQGEAKSIAGKGMHEIVAQLATLNVRLMYMERKQGEQSALLGSLFTDRRWDFLRLFIVSLFTAGIVVLLHHFL